MQCSITENQLFGKDLPSVFIRARRYKEVRMNALLAMSQAGAILLFFGFVTSLIGALAVFHPNGLWFLWALEGHYGNLVRGGSIVVLVWGIIGILTLSVVG